MKDLPRYSKALALRAQRGSLNLISAQNKMQQGLIYSRQLQKMLTPSSDDFIQLRTGIQEISRVKDDISMDYPEEKRS